ncbi:SAM-dependent methyltransferase [Novosphingobium mangrovi (ex Huang et al. 2023)]|uniref:Cyclopropane-fatty-acyl-phospholipid synthase family protein n=1 Tax=Novosphingobium mangrovi (ex Huang et al. 2023) TaxID=2976432 RepID=A0ABT2I784_9SPHN|nr:cyclopropane-fatty-acyl-phospholipid synthase family protein [Novosphingobium mangrovi (ex Huang et al. 2023)]MCT2400679.1 cyclopropane-fatty-acyl-phospholipid synthase family protein [Novosphingobium mangrovi (ex Huang et al. 2023)]
MNAQVPGRGEELVAGGRAIGVGPQWLARLWAGGVDRILERIDRGLVSGSIQATLPGGTTRVLGGREPGFGAVVEIRSWRALLRLATAGSVGWYQAWEAGEWDSPDPVPLFALFMDNATALGDVGRAHGPWRLASRFLHWLHRNTRSGSLRNIHAHYDLGNDFYAQWLGETMLYSSALFSRGEEGPNALSQFVTELDAAQSAKAGAIVERLDLEPGNTVLEIGCGWGTLAAFMADHARVHVDAISLSDEQLAFARARWGIAQGSVDFRKQDYRDVAGVYDAVASVEMVEAVGRQFWPDFLDCVARNLKPGGRAAIQFIAMRDEIFESYARSADFIQTFIFPGGMLIKESEFRQLAQDRGLGWEDRHGFGQDYARTLREWRRNFDLAVEEGRLPEGFDERFVRLWRFYLMYCEGGFLGGGIDVAQVTLVKGA